MLRVCCLGVLLASAALCAEPVKFNRDIRPIMADTCFRCHGPDKSSRMMNLRLDLRDEAIKQTKSGVTPIVPGDPGKSAIIQRIFATNAKIMPPKSAHKELTPAQKDTIRRWVAEGAQYEGHWAYEAVRRPAPPASGNPIDAFIRERLTHEHLTPSPEADRRTLLRRVTLDLTGLPPAQAEMDAFLKDQSPDAYRKVVDRLLASPRYAEQQTMHWLDVVHYADTAGFHGDNPYPAWPYRDYVLRAFRDNKPFDVFTREQLAGDLLPNATTEQKVASTYNRLNRVSAEGGIQPKEYLAKYGADRVRTISAAWMGATMGCAECHDHKFDPILTKDFYAMKAFFADISETGLVPDRGVKAWGAKLPLPDEEQRRQLQALEYHLKFAKAEWESAASPTDAWTRQMLAGQKSGARAWQYQRPVSATAQHGAKLTIYNDEPVESNYYLRGSLATERKPGEGLIIASGPNADNETYTIRLRPGAGTWQTLGIDVHQDESLPGVRLSRGADRFLLTEVEAFVTGQPVQFQLATSTNFGEAPENSAMAAIDGDPTTGWGQSSGEAHNPFLALVFATPMRTGPQTVITVRLHHDSPLRKATIGRFRLALSPEVAWPEPGESALKSQHAQPDHLTLNTAVGKGVPIALAIPAKKRDEAQQKAVRDFYTWTTPSLRPLARRLADLEHQHATLEARVPLVMATVAAEPRETRILARGNWMDDSGAIVEPAIPVFLGKLNTGAQRATRLDLANWLVSANNPLTARVYVNRQWRLFFGTGLSKVLDDLGSQGEWPAHPELLDWLAAEFMQPQYDADGAHPWDVRHLIRTIVLSDTYRQSSQSTPQLDERDPDNRLLARQSRLRMDAENIRDAALAVSGLLVEGWGGPPVKPYQPAGYYAAMNFPKREYSASHGEALFRRTLYTHWQRTFLHPSLLNFDAPTREECTVNRVTSNTPLQALDLLNDPIYVEASRVFAQKILQHGGRTFDAQITYAFQQALNRAPRPDERQILTTLHAKDLQRFRATPAAARQFINAGESPVAATLPTPDLAAMTTVARAILNLHETITRD